MEILIYFLLGFIFARYIIDLFDNIIGYINNKITLKINKDTSQYNLESQKIQNKIDKLEQVESNVIGFQVDNNEIEEEQ